MAKNKNIFKRFGKFVSNHKIGSAVCGVVLVGVLGVGGVALGNNAIKVANSQMALEIAEENGGITTETLKALEENGGLAEFGTEIVDPATGETVVLTQNADGSISKTVTRDASGNDTGYSAPTPGHSHTFVPHYTTGTRTVTTPVYHPAVTERVCVKQAGTYCNTCGTYLPTANDQIEHSHATGHGGTHVESAKYENRVVQEAYTENVASQENYQYVDYYYCSDCGARQ